MSGPDQTCLPSRQKISRLANLRVMPFLLSSRKSLPQHTRLPYAPAHTRLMHKLGYAPFGHLPLACAQLRFHSYPAATSPSGSSPVAYARLGCKRLHRPLLLPRSTHFGIDTEHTFP